MDMYSDLRDQDVFPLLQEYGTDINLKVTTGGVFDDIASKSTGGFTVNYPGFGIITGYKSADIDGTVIKRTDRKLICALSDTTVTPSTDDSIFIPSLNEEYTIQNVDGLAPAGVVVMWTLQLRK